MRERGRDVARLGAERLEAELRHLVAWKLAWVVRGRASPGILDSYDQERRPHARKMIRLARFFGELVMPRSRSRAVVVHGAMALLRRISWFRRFFDDLGMKPANAFPRGLFVRGGARRRRGALLPQGRVCSPTGAIAMSDDALLVPGLATPGWCVVVRPDRTILHDGPAERADAIVRESLSLLGALAA